MDLKKTLVVAGALTAVRKALDAVQHLDIDDALGTVGLQRRRSLLAKTFVTLGVVALTTIGVAGIALLLAPRSGGELYASVAKRLSSKAKATNGAADATLVPGPVARAATA